MALAREPVEGGLIHCIAYLLVHDHDWAAYALRAQRPQYGGSFVRAASEFHVLQAGLHERSRLIVAANDNDRPRLCLNLLRVYCLRLQLDLEPERAAFAECAVDANRTAMQLDDLLDDGQPEPGAAEAIDDGVVGLREALEYARLRFRADADAGVGHLEAQPHLVAFMGNGIDRNRDMAVFGELYPIAGKIDEHLLEVMFVANQQLRRAWGAVDRQMYAFASRLYREHVSDFFEHGHEVEIGGLDRICPASAREKSRTELIKA